QPLIWPGEFVLGYPQMDRDDPLNPVEMVVEPKWAVDGSFVVFRRLYQDVPAFRRFIAAGVQQLVASGFGPIPADGFAAVRVGRWASGPPTRRAPMQDDPRFVGDTIEASNSFFFAADTAPVTWIPASGRAPDTLPPARRDLDGLTCPLGAHIRKVNPRDDITD